MRRSVLVVYLSFATLFLPTLMQRASAEDMPIIVSYELRKQREEAAIIARNPKAFWVRQIVARMETEKPELPKPLAQPVTVRLSFTVARDGHVVSKSISESSGNPDVDGRAIAMLDRAQPFPPMPAAMADRDLSFTLPVRFR